jgi:glutathione S-transferase
MKEQIPAVADQNRRLVARYFEFLDAQLASRAFFAGDTFSMADIIALCTLDFAANLNGLRHAPEQRHLTRWYERVSSRPSAAA